jgi:hypothetical protein
MSDAADGWVQDVRLFEKEMCSLISWIFYLPVIAAYLTVFSNPPEYDKAEGCF